MGNRYVVRLNDENGNFVCGAYAHWSASDGDELDKAIIYQLEWSEEQDTQRKGYLALKKTFDNYNHNNLAGLTEEWNIWENGQSRKVELPKTFDFKNKYNNTVWGEDKTEGLITFDEEVMKDWESWTEWYSEFLVM